MKPTYQLFKLAFSLAMLIIIAGCKKEADPKAGNSQLLTFEIQSLNVTGIIDGNTVLLLIPSTTSINFLVPTLTIPAGATITPASGEVQNFSKPVEYQVTASNGSQTTYTVKVVPIKASIGQGYSCPNMTYGTSGPVKVAALRQDNNDAVLTMSTAEGLCEKTGVQIVFKNKPATALGVGEYPLSNLCTLTFYERIISGNDIGCQSFPRSSSGKVTLSKYDPLTRTYSGSWPYNFEMNEFDCLRQYTGTGTFENIPIK